MKTDLGVPMPRPERPLELNDGPLTSFASDLRKLRETAGSPPYRTLARQAHYSVTTLSEAAGGRMLPSLAVTLSYVRACGGDPVEWEQRWRDTSARLARPAATASTDPAELRAPYLGLAAFQAADADRFFGREILVESLRDQVRQHRLVGVLGASGSGKSSLLRAGLVSTARMPSVVFTPGMHPMEECAVQLAVLTGESAPLLRQELAADPTALHLRIRQTLAANPGRTDLLLVVDQFEELFTLCGDAAERQDFITALVHAATTASSQTRVVLGVRSDFFTHCAGYPELHDALSDGQVLVGPMTSDELREAIVKPAAAANLTVDTALVTRLVAETANRPGVLPLVSHALLETWHRRQGMALTAAGYEEVGGIRHALARTAEAAYTAFTQDQQTTARQILLRLTALGEGTEDTKRRINRVELDDTDEVRVVLAALACGRLIVLDHHSVEIAHEALIGHWPRLRDWLAEDREGLHIHRQLTEATTVWEAMEHDPEALYRGARLVRAREWIGSTTPGLSGREQAFVTASVDITRQEAQLARRRTRRLRQLVAALAVLLVLATGITTYSVAQQETIARQRDAETIQNVINEIPTIHGRYFGGLSDELALALYRRDPTPQNLGRVLASDANTVTFRPNVGDSTLGGRRGVIALSTDGLTYAVGSDSGAIIISRWSGDPNVAKLVSATIPGPYIPPDALYDGAVNSIAIARDGRTLAASRDDGTVTLWNIANLAAPSRLRAVTYPQPREVEFTTDGQYLTVASCAPTMCMSTEVTTVPSDHFVQFWELNHLDNKGVEVRLESSDGPVSIAANGSILAAWNPTFYLTGIKIWDVGNVREGKVTLLNESRVSDAVTEMAASPDGRKLAITTESCCSTAVRLKIAQVATGGRLTDLATLPVDFVAPFARPIFSPNGRELAAVQYNRSSSLWNVFDSQQPQELAEIPLDGAYRTIFLTGDRLAGIGIEGVKIWSTNLDLVSSKICSEVKSAPLKEWPQWDSFFPNMHVPEPCAS
ncbi:NACHT and WD repeat domain-containing protein [Kutzneria sp. NPDC051319]|uniref:NACHT and WD repeat domain-containing protein n=1 Tax=Kutzneria sp. NPDC051319 TaxID=3155047 RepID=UPI003415DFBA